jgi:hypothetical protein
MCPNSQAESKISNHSFGELNGSKSLVNIASEIISGARYIIFGESGTNLLGTNLCFAT